MPDNQSPMSAPRHLRILYVAALGRGWYSSYRLLSLQRLGHTVLPLDVESFQNSGNVISRKIYFRTQMGAPIRRMNEAVLNMAKQQRVDLVWFDKPLWMRAATLRALRQSGILTVDYMIDNPFGPPPWPHAATTGPRGLCRVRADFA